MQPTGLWVDIMKERRQRSWWTRGQATENPSQNLLTHVTCMYRLIVADYVYRQTAIGAGTEEEANSYRGGNEEAGTSNLNFFKSEWVRDVGTSRRYTQAASMTDALSSNLSRRSFSWHILASLD